MAAITNAVFTTPSVVVKDTYFYFDVEFQSGTAGSYVTENINSSSLTYQDFGGSFNLDTKTKIELTATSKYRFSAKSSTAGDYKITLNLETITDVGSSGADIFGTGTSESAAITVIDSPDFSAFTHTTQTFALTKYFTNPLSAETDNTTWTITGDFSVIGVATVPNTISFANNQISVAEVSQHFVSGDPDVPSDTGNAIGNQTFVDVVSVATATNDAGSVEYPLVLRIKSAKPSIVARRTGTSTANC